MCAILSTIHAGRLPRWQQRRLRLTATSDLDAAEVAEQLEVAPCRRSEALHAFPVLAVYHASRELVDQWCPTTDCSFLVPQSRIWAENVASKALLNSNNSHIIS